jgi:hypothetical protein
MRLTTERTKRIDVPDDPDKAFINIIALDLDLITKIEENCSNIIIGDSDSSDSIGFKPAKREDGIAKNCLKSFGNFFDVKGSEIKFKKSNFKEVAKFAIDIDGKRVRFFEWVANEHDKFYDEVLIEEKEATKNL